MFKNLLIAMDLSYASMCLLRCVGPLRTAGAESATLIHVMNVRDVGGLYISMKNLVEPLLKDKEKQLVLLIPITSWKERRGKRSAKSSAATFSATRCSPPITPNPPSGPSITWNMSWRTPTLRRGPSSTCKTR